ncbi:MAG: hypothetical protein JEZ00_21035 [Anaerolineaceae bacterium]|nr:hypothetical protein [Anaerolineaceae bacterium]
MRHYNSKVIEGHDPNGRRHYWFSDIPLTKPDNNSNYWAIDNELVTLTPLRMGLINEEWLGQLTAEMI